MKNSESVEDAKNLLAIASSVVQQVFQKKVLDFQATQSQEKLSTLELDQVIKPGKETERERALLDIFKDETIGTADSLITGMKREIEGRIIMENRERKLDTVESDFVEKFDNKTNKLQNEQ